MATTTNYGWTTPDDTALVKDGASAIRTLGSSVDTTTKNLNPETTLGDISFRSSTSNVNTRLGIGTTGQVLNVAGGVPAWTTISAGGMTLLQSLALSGSSVTSSTLTGTYKQFFVYIKGAYASAQEEFRMRLNADTATNYAWQDSEFSTTTSFTRNGAQSSMRIGTISQVSAIKQTTNMAMTIMNPADTDSVFINCTSVWGAGASDILQERTVGVYDSAAAITSITLFPGSGTLTAGTAYIYGVN